jgi:hypothetical protein
VPAAYNRASIRFHRSNSAGSSSGQIVQRAAAEPSRSRIALNPRHQIVDVGGAQPLERRVECAERRRDQVVRNVDRHRQHVVVGGLGHGVADLPGAADPAGRDAELVDGRAGRDRHAARCEVRGPRREPRLRRRPAHRAVVGDASRCEVEDQLHRDRADGARRAAPRIHRHHRARYRAQLVLEGWRVVVALQEVPPRDLLVLAEPALVARREELEDLGGERPDVAGVDVELWKNSSSASAMANGWSSRRRWNRAHVSSSTIAIALWVVARSASATVPPPGRGVRCIRSMTCL